MASVRSRDTKPELIVRKFLFSKGYRFRVNHKRLPGRPDIVLRKYRTVIFVNGCFWHGHEGCKHFILPKSNVEFWRSKIERNKNRDVSVWHKLANMGWRCLTIWECQLRPPVCGETLKSLDYTLNGVFLKDIRARGYRSLESEKCMAAEPECGYGV